MESSTGKVDPFGLHRLPPGMELLARCCRLLPDNWSGRRIAFLLRKPVLRVAGRCVDCTVDGANFRLYPVGNLSDKRLLCTPAMLDGAERRFFSRRLPPAGWVIDAGANIGGYSLLLAVARPDLRFLAIEPDLELAARLKTNIGFNPLAARISIATCAVTETDGPVKLDRDRINLGRNRIISAAAPPGDAAGEVSGYSLLTLLEQYGIDRPAALKLDIEGHEFAVLKGFFAQAPASRWPEFIQLEQYRRAAPTAAGNLVREQGYAPCLRGRMNIIFRRMPAE
jgi:FkbM family methyltransferase